jgi:hypothetical protein
VKFLKYDGGYGLVNIKGLVEKFNPPAGGVEFFLTKPLPSTQHDLSNLNNIQ